MERLKVFKNKYIITIAFFIVYIFFLDDVDIFQIVRQEVRLNKLRKTRIELSEQYKESKFILEQMGDDVALERFARENKFFKHDDEDIFVIVYE